MRKLKLAFYFFCYIFFIYTCTNSDGDCCNNDQQNIVYVSEISLKDVSTFPIGNVVSANKILNNNLFVSTLVNDFNSITAENDMKMRNMFVGPNQYDFSDGDIIVSFAKNNGIRVLDTH